MGVDFKGYLFGMEHQIRELKRRNRVLRKTLKNIIQRNMELRKEMAHLEKEREMLWKTVDRLEREKSERNRYSITKIIATNKNRAALQTIDGETGELGYVAVEITADGKVRGLG